MIMHICRKTKKLLSKVAKAGIRDIGFIDYWGWSGCDSYSDFRNIMMKKIVLMFDLM